MIDLHAHIIPEVDDGAATLAEAVKMLKIAREDGITAMVATPHLFNALGEMSDIVRVHDMFYVFKKQIARQNLHMQIYLGAEIFFVSGLREKLNNYRQLLTINNSDYFLLEFPLDFVFPGTKEFIFDIMMDGLVPIICHPERNVMIQHNPGLVYELVEAGALTQINAGSLTGHFGPEAQVVAQKMLLCNLVHTIASDCHDPVLRPPRLSFIFETY